jgi:Ca2+/Na+ antiporter
MGMWTTVAMVSYAALVIFAILALISYIRKTRRHAQYIFFVCLCCLFILFSLKIIPHMKMVQAERENHANKPLGAYAKSTLSNGEDGIINEDTFISLSEDMDDFNTMQAYIIANDGESLKRMMKLGKVYLAVKGTEINLISKSFVRAKVEISSTRRIGLVPTAFVSKE